MSKFKVGDRVLVNWQDAEEEKATIQGLLPCHDRIYILLTDEGKFTNARESILVKLLKKPKEERDIIVKDDYKMTEKEQARYLDMANQIKAQKHHVTILESVNRTLKDLLQEQTEENHELRIRERSCRDEIFCLQKENVKLKELVSSYKLHNFLNEKINAEH